ncbi:SH3 domain-containing protein [Neobacillus sp. LXY-1]|uniref:SH3 domain-containing protein n=1 Tax=Neobacillus sp. LXY-1 TaxID=3379133 RepID=UPI003EE1CE6C
MSKRSRVLLLCFILLLGAFLPPGKGSASSGTVTIASDFVNIRSGPGLSYSLVQKAKRGDKYQIIKEQDDWIQIQLSFGKTGWVANWLVNKDNQNTAPTSTTTSTGMTAKSISDQLRVRSGPGTSFRVIGYLNTGQVVPVITQNENWVKVSSTFGEGWVSKDFVTVTSGQSSNPSSGSSGSIGSGVVNGDIINVRKEPTTSSTILGKLTKGTKVTIYSRKNNWLDAKYSNLRGWVSADFITTGANTTGSTPQQGSTNINGKVTATSLNVRSGASQNTAIVGTVTQGQVFVILAESNSWAKIEYKKGSYGWVASWYLEKTTGTTSSGSTNSGQTSSQQTVTILTDGTNIRKTPTTGSDVVLRANKGDKFPVKSVQNDWYEITLNNGSTGYVAGWIVYINGQAPAIGRPSAEGYIKGKTIVIDPGHGGEDSGTLGATGTLEKKLTLRTAQLLYDKLKAAGANVYLTRSNDTFISLSSRVSVAQYRNADAFISLHYDSSIDRSAKGTTGYYYHSYQKQLAETVFSYTASQTRLNNRGVRFGDFHVIRENSQKATLIELGYLSNPQEEITLNSSAFQENAATGLYNGLSRYFKNN